MKKIYYSDICKEKLHELKTLTLKQISRCNYEINNDEIETIIEHTNQRFQVILKENDASVFKFRQDAKSASPHEPSLDFMAQKLQLYFEPSLLIALKKYKKDYYTLGEKIKENLYFKFYSEKPLTDPSREKYHATWLDYEKQLQNGDEIYDSNDLNGIWAMPYNMFIECIKIDKCYERYGNKFFIVAPIPSVYYLIDEEEIIGKRFKVIEKIDLNNKEDISKLINTTVEANSKKITAEYSATIKALEETNEKYVVALKSLDKKNKSLKFIIKVLGSFIFILTVIIIILLYLKR